MLCCRFYLDTFRRHIHGTYHFPLYFEPSPQDSLCRMCHYPHCTDQRYKFGSHLLRPKIVLSCNVGSTPAHPACPCDTLQGISYSSRLLLYSRNCSRHMESIFGPCLLVHIFRADTVDTWLGLESQHNTRVDTIYRPSRCLTMFQKYYCRYFRPNAFCFFRRDGKVRQPTHPCICHYRMSCTRTTGCLQDFRARRTYRLRTQYKLFWLALLDSTQPHNKCILLPPSCSKTFRLRILNNLLRQYIAGLGLGHRLRTRTARRRSDYTRLGILNNRACRATWP